MDSAIREVGPEVWKQSLQSVNKQNNILIQAIEHIDQVEKRVTQTANEAKQLVDMAVEELTIKYDEQRKVQSAVQNKANILTKLHVQNIYGDVNYGGSNFFNAKKGQFTCAIYKNIKEQFQVARYTSLRRIDFQNALKFIDSLTLDDFKDSQTRVTEHQQQILDRFNRKDLTNER